MFPHDVVSNGLGDFCSYALLEDVVWVALKQNPEAGRDEIVKAIAHYMENDDFLRT